MIGQSKLFRNRRRWRWVTIATALLPLTLFAGGNVINVDFGPDPGTHGAVSGKGPLGGGTFWNLADGTLANLDDSEGKPTSVDVVVTNGSAGERFAAASNALQDDYLMDDPAVTFVIGDLDPAKTYSLAVFAHATFAHRVTIRGDAATAVLAGLDWQGRSFGSMVEGLDFKVAGGFSPKSGSNTIEVTVERDGAAGSCFFAGFQIAENFAKADGLIGSRRNRLGGDDVYRRRGGGSQKLREVLNRPRVIRNFIAIENDGLMSEDFNIRQKGRSRVRRREFRVKYFRLTGGRNNISAAMRRGTASFLLLAREADRVLILQKIKPKRRALRTRPRIRARIDVECYPDDNNDVSDQDNLRSIVVVRR